MKIKLQDYLKHHGYASSNRTAKNLIRDHVVMVNGVQAKSCSVKVGAEKSSSVQVIIRKDNSDRASEITMDYNDSSVVNLSCNKHSQESFCVAFNKPCGMICTLAPSTTSGSTSTKGGHNITTLRDIQPPMPESFRPVGRLDQHSHGLLLFSSDGRLTSALLSPRTAVTRIYRIVVRGDVGVKKGSEKDNMERYEMICNTVEKGVETDYGFFQGRIIHMERDVYRDGHHNYAHAKCGIGGGKRNDRFDDRGTNNNRQDSSDKKEGVNSSIILSSIIVAVEEGKKRMVRRLFAAIGLFVLDLERIKYGDVELGDLLSGEWRYLVDKDMEYCRDIIRQWEKDGAGWDKL